MCGSCPLDSLLAEADAVEGLLEPLLEASRTSGFEKDPMRIIQGKMRRQMGGAVTAFQRGSIDAATMERRFSKAINGAYPDAYRLGVSQFPMAQITGADRDFLKRAASSEMTYASRFAKDIAGGKMSDAQIGSRLDQYVLGSESMKTSGWTRKSPPETTFDWDLGMSAHCSDCLVLAASSPYTRDTLPTVPRAGDTCVTSPGSRVLTRRGWVPIVAVRIGDRVLTHRGRWRRVLDTPRTCAPAQREGAELRVGSRRVGLTADHPILTFAGWMLAEQVAHSAVRMIQLHHVTQGLPTQGMLGMQLAHPLGSQVGSVQSVRLDLLVREDQRSSRGSMCIMRNEDQGETSVGRSRSSAPDGCTDARRPKREASPIRRLAVDTLPLHQDRGRTPLCVVLGHRQTQADLSLPVGVDQSGRSDSRGIDSPSSKRESDRRSTAQFRVDDAKETRESAHDVGKSRCDGPDARRQASDSTSVRTMWGSILRGDTDAQERGIPGATILLEDLCRSGKHQADDAYLRGVSIDVRAESIGDREGTTALLLGQMPGRHEGSGQRGSDVRMLQEAIRAQGIGGQEEQAQVLLTGLLQEGTTLYDLTVEEDHSFIVEGVVLHNSCRSRCNCSLIVRSEAADPRRQVSVNTTNPEATSGVKRVGPREPTARERARVDDMRSRINYHRRRIETAETEAARQAAIQARRAANAELINYQQARGIRDVPMLDVGDVISGTQISADVAEGLAIRGIDGTTILLADAEEWSATTASLLARIEEILNEGG